MPLHSRSWPHRYRRWHPQGRLRAAATCARFRHGGTCSCSWWTEAGSLCTRTLEAGGGRSPAPRSEQICLMSRPGVPCGGQSEEALALSRKQKYRKNASLSQSTVMLSCLTPPPQVLIQNYMIDTIDSLAPKCSLN